MRCIVQDRMPNEPWVKYSGMDPGPMASAGLGPSLGHTSFVRSSSSLEYHFSLKPIVSSLCLSLHSLFFFQFSFNLSLGMGYSYLLSSEDSLASFRAAYNIPKNVNITYCHDGDIDLHRCSGTNDVFFPLMAILEGGVTFPLDPLIIGILRFYGLCEKVKPNIWSIVKPL